MCADATPPAEGASYSACTAVMWTDSANVAPGLFDGLTAEAASTVAASMLGAWALAFCLRALRKQIEAA